MAKYRVAVCKGPNCRLGGAEKVYLAAREAVAQLGLQKKCELYRGGCYGLCHLGPNVVLRVDNGRPRDFLSQEDFQLMGWEGETHYGAMDPEKILRVLREHVGQDHPVEELRGERTQVR